MNRRELLIAGGVLAAGAAVAAVLIFARSKPGAETPPDRAPIVQTAPVTRQTGPVRIAASGTVRPRRAVDLSAQVSGRAVYVHPRLQSGGRVREGEVLVRLEQADYVNRVRQARAALRQAEVELQQTEQEAELARQEYERFRARSARALEPALVEPDDYASRFLPPGGLDLGAARAPAPEAPNPLVFREPQLQAARAAVDRARAQLDDARLALSRTEVRAPFNAVVRSEDVEAGAFVQPGQPLASLYGSEALEVVAPISNAALALLPRLGGAASGPRPSARVTVGYGPRAFAWRAFADRVEGAVDEQTRTIDVVVRVPRPLTGATLAEETTAGGAAWRGAPPPLLPGQFADITIEGVSPETYFAAPRTALRRDDEVWLVEDETLRKTPVDVIQFVGDTMLVQGALEDGERVIVGDVSGAVDGMAVRLAEQQQRAAR